MNAIAALLQRAVAELGETTAVPTSKTSSEPFAQGSFVTLSTLGVDELAGRVGFTDDGWVYWAAVDGSFHATRRDALKEI